jgi:autotransporter-associated beta strand protein
MMGHTKCAVIWPPKPGASNAGQSDHRANLKRPSGKKLEMRGKMRRTKISFLFDLILLALAASSFMGSTSFAQTSTWTSTTGGLWGTPANWSGNVVAGGSGNTADFSELGISGTVTVGLDSSYTIGNLIFGNTASSITPGSWILGNNDSATNVLTLASPPGSGAPTITVDALGAGASATISASLSGSSGLTIAGPGLLVLSGSNGYTGATTVNAGTLNYAGGAVSSGASTLNVGGVSGTGVVNIASSATLTFSSNSSVGGVSTNTAGAGAINQSSGNVAFVNGSIFALGNGSSAPSGTYGSYVLSGGSLYVSASTFRVGYYGQGVYSQSGGSLDMVGTLFVSFDNGGVATFTGGSAVVSGLVRLAEGASAGGGVLNVGTAAGGNAVVSLPTANEGIVLASGEGATSGILNLDSGTLATAGVIEAAAANTNAFVNFNGGTLEPLGSSLTLINTTASNPAPRSVNIYNGGAIFNTNGYTATVAATLLATAGDGIYPSGGSIALSSGTGSGGSGYIGAPLVGVSGPSGSGATAVATISNGAINGVTLTCPGQNYLPGEVLTFSFSGGGALTPAGSFQYTLQPGDVAANGSGGVTKTGSGNLILSGANTYLGNTVVTGGSLTIKGVTSSTGSLQASNSAALYVNAANSASSLLAGGGASVFVNSPMNSATSAQIGSGASLVVGSSGTMTSASSVQVASGALTVNGLIDSAGTVQVGGGATLAGSGSVGNVTVLSGGSLQAGQNGNGSLTLNSLTLGAGGAVNVYGLASSPPVLQVSGNVTALGGSGSVAIDVDVNPGTGTYEVLTYSGSLTDFSALTASVPNLGPRGTATLLNEPGEVALQVQTAYPIWTGTVSTAWNTSSVLNWKLNTNGAPTYYIQGDNVVFDDSAGTNVVDISAANVMPSTVQFNNNHLS